MQKGTGTPADAVLEFTEHTSRGFSGYWFKNYRIVRCGSDWGVYVVQEDGHNIGRGEEEREIMTSEELRDLLLGLLRDKDTTLHDDGATKLFMAEHFPDVVIDDVVVPPPDAEDRIYKVGHYHGDGTCFHVSFFATREEAEAVVNKPKAHVTAAIEWIEETPKTKEEVIALLEKWAGPQHR